MCIWFSGSVLSGAIRRSRPGLAVAGEARRGWANPVFATGSVITDVVTFVVGESKDGVCTPVQVCAP